MTKDPITLAEFVSTERARQRLSLQHIADAAGCTKAHVGDIALGKATNPSVTIIRGLAVALGCDPEVVFRCALASLPGLPSVEKSAEDSFDRGYQDYQRKKNWCPADAEPETWMRGWLAGKAQDRVL